MDQRPFLDKLTALLGDSDKRTLFPCIGDLVANGLQTARFASSGDTPNRQTITQYLAAWCKEAQLSEETCKTWLTDYALSMLAPLSRSSPSDIRHSTKSNVKYIYACQRPFICERKDNVFRAACSETCPVYHEMVDRVAAIAAAEAARAAAMQLLQHAAMVRRESLASVAKPAPPKLKDVYREQFQSAIQLITDELAKGTSRKTILSILRERDMKTKTGRAWTAPLLLIEVQKLARKRLQVTSDEQA